jgi:hypothetical protein
MKKITFTLLLAVLTSFAFAQESFLEIRNKNQTGAELWLNSTTTGAYYELHTSSDLKEAKLGFPQEITSQSFKVKDIFFNKEREFYQAVVQDGFLIVDSGFDPTVNIDRVVQVDDNDDTDDIEVYSIDLLAVGRDINLKDLSLDFEMGEKDLSTDLEDMIKSVKVLVDGDEIESENFSISGKTGTLNFYELDFVIDKNNDITLSFEVDLDDQSGNYENWDSFRVSGIEVFYSAGSTANGVLKPRYPGGLMGLATEGILVGPFVSGSTSVSSPIAQFSLEFELTAFGSDIFIPQVDGIVFEVIGPGENVLDILTYSAINTTADETVEEFVVDEDTGESFTLTVVVDNTGGASSVFAGVRVKEFRFRNQIGGPIETTSYGVDGTLELSPVLISN